MTFRSVALACALSVVAASAAQATPNHGWYVSAEFGMDQEHTPAGTAGSTEAVFGMLGWQFAQQWAAELELGYRGSGSSYTGATQETLMLNIIRSFALDPAFNVDVGIGVGFDSVEPENTYYGDGGTAAAGQAFAGLRYEVNESLDVFVRARVLATTDASFDTESGGVGSRTVSLGIRYAF